MLHWSIRPRRRIAVHVGSELCLCNFFDKTHTTSSFSKSFEKLYNNFVIKANTPYFCPACRQAGIAAEWYISSYRQLDKEGASLPGAGGGDPHFSFVVFDDFFHKVESDAHAVRTDFFCFIASCKFYKQLTRILAAYAEPPVGNRKAENMRTILFYAFKRQYDSPGGRIFDRVVYEINNRLMQFFDVSPHRSAYWDTVIKLKYNIFLAGGFFELFHHPRDDVFHMYIGKLVLHFARLNARKVQQIVH